LGIFIAAWAARDEEPRKPIDLADCPDFHVRLSDLGAIFPCAVPDHVDMAADQLNTPARERPVELRPVRLLRVPADNAGGALWPGVECRRAAHAC